MMKFDSHLCSIFGQLGFVLGANLSPSWVPKATKRSQGRNFSSDLYLGPNWRPTWLDFGDILMDFGSNLVPKSIKIQSKFIDISMKSIRKFYEMSKISLGNLGSRCGSGSPNAFTHMVWRATRLEGHH